MFAERGFEAAKVQDISRGGAVDGHDLRHLPEQGGSLPGHSRRARPGAAAVARGVAAPRAPPRQALEALIEAYVDYFVDHPDFLRMHLRHGTSWVLGPSLGPTSAGASVEDIHELQAEIFRRGIAAGVFVDEDPAYLAKLFSAMDQVLLADWVAGGMKADRAALARPPPAHRRARGAGRTSGERG